MCSRGLETQKHLLKDYNNCSIGLTIIECRESQKRSLSQSATVFGNYWYAINTLDLDLTDPVNWLMWIYVFKLETAQSNLTSWTESNNQVTQVVLWSQSHDYHIRGCRMHRTSRAPGEPTVQTWSIQLGIMHILAYFGRMMQFHEGKDRQTERELCRPW